MNKQIQRLSEEELKQLEIVYRGLESQECTILRLLAMIREAREALKDGLSNAEIQIRGGIKDENIADHLTAICERHGYGNVMCTVSTIWREKDPIGAFCYGGCVATVQRFRNLALSALGMPRPRSTPPRYPR